MANIGNFSAAAGLLTLALIFGASTAEAQFIDCAGGCTTVQYGLGNDSREGPYDNSVGLGHSRPDGIACGPRTFFRFQGRIKITDQDSCVVSSTNRCMVEIPQADNDSGTFNVNRSVFDLGPLGLFAGNGAIFDSFGGNIGFRELNGNCTETADECALDSDCSGGTDVCRSTCFSDPETVCAGHGDCPNADCVTKIEFDGIGTCTDDTTVCSVDADCPGENICESGLEFTRSDASCICCQSTSGVFCPGIGWPEYPGLLCPAPANPWFVREAADLIFDGGRGTKFAHGFVTPPGQQEGLCAQNDQRPCGVRGDFWAGAANGKCIGGAATCPDPLIGDPTQGAEASVCDDVAFGGIAGDVCDFSERGYRSASANFNPDRTPSPIHCQSTQQWWVGTPNELCTLPVDIPDGDPGFGCVLSNFGIAAQPDLNCNDIDDTLEGRCMPEGGVTCSDLALCPPCSADDQCASGVCVSDGDLCPFIGEDFFFKDSNNDNIGDDCQCGDGNGDGAITGLDIAAMALCANGVSPPEVCDDTKVDTTGDQAITAVDIGGVVAAVNGEISTSDLLCIRNIDSTNP